MPVGTDDFAREAWRSYLTTGKPPKGVRQPWFENPRFRPFFRVLPRDPRCQLCYIPFKGVGGVLARHVLGVTPSPLNPRLCNACERFAEKFLGGVEMEASVLFADIRGSTALAEQLGPAEFSNLVHRFYGAAVKPLIAQNALIQNFMGDGLISFFVPAFSGPNHAKAAIEAGRGILHATGNKKGQTPWILVGVGVNTGEAYIGSVRVDDGRTDIPVLGDTVNTAARLCSEAAGGELFVSKRAGSVSGLAFDQYELRQIMLKGKQDSVEAWVVENK
ncbi:MAG: adenylate/guanylate cyclase domain-containing protein [Pseudomonadota bacterium]